MSYTNSSPKYKATFKPKITSPFCHEWQRVSHWEVIILSSLEELALSSSSSPSSPSLSTEAFREGDGEGAKPPRRACCHAIRLTRVFIWHISSVRESRQASMHWSCARMASKVTPIAEEGAEVEGAKEEGAIGSVWSVISVRGRFGQSWASLRKIEPMLMVWETAPPACFIECWAKPTWMGGVMLLPLKMEVRLIIFPPLRLRVLQWSYHLFNYWKYKKTIIEKFLILLIWNWIYIDRRKITWVWS